MLVQPGCGPHIATGGHPARIGRVISLGGSADDGGKHLLAGNTIIIEEKRLGRGMPDAGPHRTALHCLTFSSAVLGVVADLSCDMRRRAVS